VTLPAVVFTTLRPEGTEGTDVAAAVAEGDPHGSTAAISATVIAPRILLLLLPARAMIRALLGRRECAFAWTREGPVGVGPR
jgi:hypothetical protein